MWFLQTDTLLILLGLSLGLGILSRLLGERYRKLLAFLPAADLAFLWYIDPKLMVFYAGYTAVTWLLAVLLRQMKVWRGGFFALCCMACLVPLAYMREAQALSLPTMGLVCIGLAYNVLKAIDLMYYEYCTGERADFWTYVNYMLFLPVLTAGPVFRYRDFQKTWEKPQQLDLERLAEGCRRIICGLFYKVVLSSFTAGILEELIRHTPGFLPSLVIPPVSVATLFFDMAGYASIAIGLGGLMGITVPENFKHPFQSPSFTQFWRNWHITVSDWIREHVFVLLHSRRLNKWQSAGISLAVMILMGLWHGFSWLFFVDGIFLGLLLAVENLFGLTTVNKRKSPKWYFFLRCAIVFYLFAMNSMIFTLSVPEIGRVIKGFLFMG